MAKAFLRGGIDKLGSPKDLNKANIVVITVPFITIAAETILSNFIEILKPLSNEIFVITGDFFKSENEKVHITSVEHNFQNKPMPIKILKRMLTHLRTSFHIIKISKNVDIVIFFIGTGTYVLPMLSAKIMGKRTILIATGSTAKGSKNVFGSMLFGMGEIILPYAFRILEEINNHLSDQIVVYSESSIYQLNLTKYNYKISNGARFVDVGNLKAKKELEKRRKLVGYIGRFSKEKGIMNFVDAIPMLFGKDEDIEFLLVGGGLLADEIKETLKKNGVYDKVELTGWVPHDKLPDCLNELKLLVLPSYTEGLPNIVLEAMACGTPVLVTPVGGIADVIKNGETGFIMESNSPECIAKDVLRVLEYQNLDGIVKKARKLIEDEYSYEKAVERYRKILKDF